MTRIVLTIAWLWSPALGVVFAEQGKTHPADYATVHEIERHGQKRLIQRTVTDIDDRSLIAISFDETKMMEPKGEQVQVRIRIEAFQTKNGDRDEIPVTKYTSRRGSPEGDIDYKQHDRPYDPEKGRDGRVPNTIIDPGRFIEKDVDQIEIRIINRETRERTVYFLRLREFGTRTEMMDTFLFFKRVCAKGELDPVNFSPAAGVTFGADYLPRDSNWFKKFAQAVHPGIGINTSILKWNDPGTEGSQLNIGLGVQVSLFNNILIATYGANLQAERNRWYYGIGISFLQLNGAISE